MILTVPAVSRRLSGAITDLGYMILATSPRLRPLYRRWAGRRYRRLAASYRDLARADPVYLRPLRALLLQLDSAPDRIVEVGAGTGAATAVLMERYPRAALVAVDASLEMLMHFAARSPAAVRRVVGDAFALPLCAHSTDLALVHNAPFDLDELIRATSPSGVVVIVLSSARWIPPVIRARLLRTRQLPGWGCVLERTIGTGVVWVFRRDATR